MFCSHLGNSMSVWWWRYFLFFFFCSPLIQVGFCVFISMFWFRWERFDSGHWYSIGTDAAIRCQCVAYNTLKSRAPAYLPIDYTVRSVLLCYQLDGLWSKSDCSAAYHLNAPVRQSEIVLSLPHWLSLYSTVSSALAFIAFTVALWCVTMYAYFMVYIFCVTDVENTMWTTLYSYGCKKKRQIFLLRIGIRKHGMPYSKLFLVHSF